MLSVYLADALPDAAQMAAAVKLMIGLASLCVIANQVMGAVNNWRKIQGDGEINPAAKERIKSLEQEMREMELRVERRIGESLGSINTRMHGLEVSVTSMVKDFSRALGRLEGASEQNP